MKKTAKEWFWLLDIIYDRRSVRKYQDKPVPKEALEEVLRAGMYAPSAMDCRPWHFVVLQKREDLAFIQSVHPYSNMLSSAPACILVCADSKRCCPGYFPEDCAAATQNILLAAKCLGLDTCWLGVYPAGERLQPLAERFGLPEGMLPFSLIAIGYGGEEKKRPERFDPEKIHYDRW